MSARKPRLNIQLIRLLTFQTLFKSSSNETMTQLTAEDPRSSSDSSVDTMEWEKGIGADIRR